MSCGYDNHKLSEEQYQIKKAEKAKQQNEMSIAEKYPDGYSIEWRKYEQKTGIVLNHKKIGEEK